MPYIKQGMGCGEGSAPGVKCGCGCKATVDPTGPTSTYGKAVLRAAGIPIPMGDLADTVSSPTAKKIGGAAATYHGYKRTGSILWALVYGAFGYFAPVTTNVVALAQGYGEKKPCP